MIEIDARAQREYGIPGALLMETAGRRAWDLLAHTGVDGPCVFVCGPGNNGGDALVMARSAVEAGVLGVSVVLMRERLSELAAKQLGLCTAVGIETLAWTSDQPACRDRIADAAFVIDGLFGAGLRSAVRDPGRAVIEAIGASPGRIVSIDLPSGLHDEWSPDDPAVFADMTVVTGLYREIHFTPGARAHCGELHRVDPGFPAALIQTAPDASRSTRLVDRGPVLPPLDPDAYKSTRGKCVIIGGAPGTSGAPILSGIAALHARAGMVRLISDPETCRTAVAAEPSLMTGDPDAVVRDLRWADALLVGPGWTDATVDDLSRILSAAREASLPVVIDASALSLVAALLRDGAVGSILWERTVLTPHLGEFATLTRSDIAAVRSRPFALLRSFRETVPATVVLKSSVTYVTGPDGTAVVDGRTPALGTAGSGDVLAGIIIALCAQGLSPDAAALEGVLLHLAAGRSMVSTHGFGTAATLARTVGVVAAHHEVQAR